MEEIAKEKGFYLYGLSDEPSPTSITSVVHSPAVDRRMKMAFSSNNLSSTWKSNNFGSPIPGDVFL